jgi:hypothetical protein
VIRKERGGSVEDLKLRREGEKGARRQEGQIMSTDLILVWFEAIPLIGGP